jgi:hypothetical protein
MKNKTPLIVEVDDGDGLRFTNKGMIYMCIIHALVITFVVLSMKK